MASAAGPTKNGDAGASPSHRLRLISVRPQARTIYAEAMAARRLLMSYAPHCRRMRVASSDLPPALTVTIARPASNSP